MVPGGGGVAVGRKREGEVTLRILRFNPAADTEPHWESYDVRYERMDRVLDALHQIKGA